MKTYIVTVMVTAESGGTNNSYPTPSRIRGFVAKKLEAGSWRDEHLRLKVKQLGALGATPLPEGVY